MKILIAHNSYQQAGGEDAVVKAEARLLEDNGNIVVRYERSSNELRDNGVLASMMAATGAVWSSSSYHSFASILRETRPDIAHFHNTFPLISPSAYFACAEKRVPVVQTLHNYRLICPGGQLLRKGQICENCVRKDVRWPGVVYGCYRGSIALTATTAAMLAVHAALGTWKRKVSLYVALSEFARAKFIEGGLPPERITVKPNFVRSALKDGDRAGDSVLFVGRVSPEKGPQLLPVAWSHLRARIPLHILGDGPLRADIAAQVASMQQSPIFVHGHCSTKQVVSFMESARCLVVPSLCYETFGLSVVEAFSCGLPVIAARIGSLAEIVRDGVTGLHFEPGSTEDLAAKVEWAWEHPKEISQMGRNARAEFEAKYEPQKNYKMLMEIYARAMAISAEEVAVRPAAQSTKIAPVHNPEYTGVAKRN